MLGEGFIDGGSGSSLFIGGEQTMNWHEWIRDIFDLYICAILTVEYFYGRSDKDIKNEAVRKKKAREKYRFESLNVGEGR